MNQQLLVVESTPALLATNFAEVEAHLKQELEKYDVVVTEDTLKDCKQLSTDLNKMSGDIDTRRKEEVAKVSKPIKEFDDNMKSLVKLCKDGRTKLIDQIKVFEDETRATIKKLMIELRQELYELNEIDEEFRTVMFDGGKIPLNYMTATGNLSGKIKTEIKHAVLACLQVQKDVEMRLVKLENESYKAGLKSPLEKVHVQAFLMDDEEAYQQKLTDLLAVEVKRQEVAEEKTREQIKKEDGKITSAPASSSVVSEEQAAGRQHREEAVEKPESPEGKVCYVLQARFEVTVGESVTSDKIVDALRKRIVENAGITTLKSIEVIA